MQKILFNLNHFLKNEKNKQKEKGKRKTKPAPELGGPVALHCLTLWASNRRVLTKKQATVLAGLMPGQFFTG